MSAALASDSGSLLAMYRSRRCGFRPASFQTRYTASLLTSSTAASLRQLQWVLGFLRVADRGGQQAHRPTGMVGVEAIEAEGQKALLPANGGRSGSLEALLDRSH
jgi:hypothetical protein